MIKINCNTQLFLLNHYNCLTRIFLNILYAIDVITYTVFGPHKFLTKRGEIFGPNFTALGRVVVGEYTKCVELINSPQKRGHYLGRAKLIPRRLPKNFILFLSDEDAGGGTLHSALHEHIWQTLIPPAFARISSGGGGDGDNGADPFKGYVKEAVVKLKAIGHKPNKEQTQQILNPLAVQYIFHSVFGMALDAKQADDFHDLFFAKSFNSCVMGALRPYGNLFGCCIGKRRRLISSLTDLILSCPALKDYVPSNSNGNLTKKNYAEVLLAVVGIAGFIGTSALCKQVLDDIPDEYSIDLDDKMAVTMAVLEAARMKAPVNNVNVMLGNKLTLTINGKEYTFDRGTPVAASIGLSSVDANQFDNPHVFNPERENLLSSSINFNHVGYSEVGSGKRQCPGRNIAIKLASDLLIEYRNSTSDVFSD